MRLRQLVVVVVVATLAVAVLSDFNADGRPDLRTHHHHHTARVCPVAAKIITGRAFDHAAIPAAVPDSAPSGWSVTLVDTGAGRGWVEQHCADVDNRAPPTL